MFVNLDIFPRCSVPESSVPHVGSTEEDGGRYIATMAASDCAVCLETFNDTDCVPARLPCCQRETSTFGVCLGCLEEICNHYTVEAGRVGKCPRCRERLYVSADGVVSKAPQPRGKCRMCCQERVLLDGGKCDACILGSQFALTYECDRCGRHQRIPHPMWRYQTTPGEFGTSTWACHNGCDDYTHWRVIEADLGRVPAHDAPEGWQMLDRWLEQLREERARFARMRPEERRDHGAVFIHRRQGCVVS